MSARRRDAIEAIRDAINECSHAKGPCRLCDPLRDAIDLLEGGDVIPPDGWSVVADRTVTAPADMPLRVRYGERLVTLRGTR